MQVRVINDTKETFLRRLYEARPLETGYHYTNIVGLINILNSGTMLASNRRIGLDDSRLNRKTLNKTIRELMKPILTNKRKNEIESTLYSSDEKVQKERIKQRLKLYVTEKEIKQVESRIKNLDMKLKDAFKANLVDKNLMLLLNPSELEFLGDYDTASRSKAIFNYEMGYSSTSRGKSGERVSGDSVYNNKSWSYTRSKVPINVLDKTPDLIRITLDIDKISRNQSIDAFTWKGNNPTTDKYEYEERVIGNTENIGRYIKSIDFPEEINDDKHYVIRNKSGKVYNLSEIADELRILFEDKRILTNNSLIRDLISGYAKKVTVKEYYLDYIADSLMSNEVKSISGKAMKTSKKLNLKSYNDVVNFIKNIEDIDSVKEPGKKRRKIIKKKLNIKIGTYKTPGLIKQFIINKAILDKLQLAQDIYTGKKEFPDTDLSKFNKNILPTWITNEIKKLPKHYGKVYIVSEKDNYWSNFLLSADPRKDIKRLADKLKTKSTDLILLNSKYGTNSPFILRNRKYCYNVNSYKNLLQLWSHNQKFEESCFDSLEDFTAFLYDYANKRFKDKFECVIATGRGGLKISINIDKQRSSFVYQSSFL